MLRYKNLESKTTNKTNFFKFLKFIGKEDLITELNAWEKKLKTKHTELTFFTYIVKYKVSALKNGLLFKVKYSYT